MIGLIHIGFVTITLWIVLAAVGVAVTAFNLYDAGGDLAFLRKQAANGRTLVAQVGIANEIARLVALTLLLVAGLLVAQVQYNPDPPPASLYVRSVIILTIAVLVAQTIVQRWLRLKLRVRSVT